MSIEGSLKIGSHEVIVSRIDGMLRYTRLTGGNVVRSIIIDDGSSMVVRPIYPLYYPKFKTQFILCKIEELLVNPASRVTIYVRIPVDAAIYSIYNNEFKIIDILPMHSRYKYVLYGPMQSGLIARYCKSNIYTSLSGIGEYRGFALSKITIKNETRNIRSISRILLDASPLKIYYRKGTWEAYTQDLEVNLVSASTAVILYGRKPLDELEQLEDPPELRPPRLLNRTDMIWGY